MTLQEWIQTIGIVVAGAWGIHTWLWKEVVVPYWAPASLDLEVSLAPPEQGEAATNAGQQLPMLLHIVATNTSSRTLYLLPNYWQLSATLARPDPSGATYQGRVNMVLLDGSIAHEQRNIEPLNVSSLAIGNLFTDETIRPGEKQERRIILQLPRGYPAINVDLLMPVLSRDPKARLFKGKQLIWGFAPPDILYPKLSSGQGSNLTCLNVDYQQLSDDIEAFDSRSTVFKRSIQFSL